MQHSSTGRYAGTILTRQIYELLNDGCGNEVILSNHRSSVLMTTMWEDKFPHYRTNGFHYFLYSVYSTEVVDPSVQDLRSARAKVSHTIVIHFSSQRTPASFISASEGKPGFCMRGDFIWKVNEAKF